VEGIAAALVAGVILGTVFMVGRLVYARLSESLSFRLPQGWRWLALPITAAVCGGGFAALRPLVVDQPRTPLWFVLGAAAVALLLACATALGWMFVQGGRKFVELAWAEPARARDIAEPPVSAAGEGRADPDDRDR
jgi:hypothetical protein